MISKIEYYPIPTRRKYNIINIIEQFLSQGLTLYLCFRFKEQSITNSLKACNRISCCTVKYYVSMYDITYRNETDQINFYRKRGLVIEKHENAVLSEEQRRGEQSSSSSSSPPTFSAGITRVIKVQKML